MKPSPSAAIRRHPDGAIDFAFYDAKCRAARGVAARQFLQNAALARPVRRRTRFAHQFLGSLNLLWQRTRTDLTQVRSGADLACE